MQISRRKTKIIKIGSVCIGANYPVAVQSMAKTKPADIEKTVRQIKELEAAGCEIVRLAVNDDADARAIKKIKAKVRIPLVADIHFNWRLALEAIDSGVDKIRLNPGNIYKKEEIKEIVKAAKINRIPIRVGLNSGSLPKGTNHRPKTWATPQIMAESALDYIRILESFHFYDIVVSLKASNIPDTVEAYRRMSKLCSYPFHLGLTAAGTAYSAVVKSSIALGALLLEGIGDTIRVSLTDKPQAEVIAAKTILEAVGLRNFGPQIISCPTCGRCEVDLVRIAKNLEEELNTKRYPRKAVRAFKIAVMGCVVNGPGEAKEADIGIAFGKKEGLLFRKGKPVKKVSSGKCVDALLEELSNNVLDA